MAGPRTDISASPPSGAFDFARAHHALLNDRALQFRADQFSVPKPREADPLLDAIGRAIRVLAPALQYVFWGGVAVIIALIVWMIAREIFRRVAAARPPPAAQPAPAPVKPQFRPRRERAQALLSEADRLAAEGRYGEAVHVLLYRSIEDMQQTLPIAIGDALTSREIGKIQYLSERGRAAFQHIADAVETSFFGGRAVDAAGFMACRNAYEAFALQR